MALDLTILNGAGDRTKNDDYYTFSGNSPLSIAVIDSRLADLDVLLAGLPKNVTPYILHPQQDAIPQINALINNRDIHSLYLIGHGRAGAMELGQYGLNIDTVERYARMIGSWQLQEILLYGCEVGQDRNFVQCLHKISGAGVAAATTRLGCGNWELDVNVGIVNTTCSLGNYLHGLSFVLRDDIKQTFNVINGSFFELGNILYYSDRNNNVYRVPASGDLDFVTNINLGGKYIEFKVDSNNSIFVSPRLPSGLKDSFPIDLATDFEIDINLGLKYIEFNNALYYLANGKEGTGVYRFTPGKDAELITKATLLRSISIANNSLYFVTDREGFRLKSNGVLESLSYDLQPSYVPGGSKNFIGLNDDVYFYTQTSLLVIKPNDEIFYIAGSGGWTNPVKVNGGLYFGSNQSLQRITSTGIFEAYRGKLIENARGNFTNNIGLTEIGQLIELDNVLYFTANAPETGVELYMVKSFDNFKTIFQEWENTDQDLINVEDINPGIASSSPSNFIKFNNSIYFSAFSPNSGRELYRLADGSVHMVKDIFPGITGSQPVGFTEFNNALYFATTLGIYRVNLNNELEFIQRLNGDNIVSGQAQNGKFIKAYDTIYYFGKGESSRLYQFVDDTQKKPIAASIVRSDANFNSAPNVSFVVTFNKPVNGVDSGDFILTTSGVTGASIISVNGDGRTYTINTATGIGNGSIGLNLIDNDTIRDGDNNPLGGVGIGNGNFTGEEYIIEKLAVESILRASPNPANGASIVFTVAFNKAVTGVDSSDFKLAFTGEINGAKINSVTGSGGIYYTVTVDTGNGNGTIGVNLLDDDSIRDSENNALGGSGNGNGDFFNGEVYTIDKSTDPLNIRAVDGEFKDNDKDGDVEFNGTVIIGRIDGTTELIRIEGGTVEYDDKEVKVTNGTVFSLIGNVSAPLFRGSFTIPFNTATTSSLDDDLRNINGDFRLGGGAINFTSLSLNKNRIGLGADFKLPPEIGGDIVASSAFDTVSITKDGVGLGGVSGRLSLDTPPKRNFRFFNLFDVEASDLSLEYVAVEEKIKLQGKFVLDSFVKESSPKITLDLSGDGFTEDNFIEIKDGKADIKGSLTLETEIKTKSGWGLSEVKLNIDTKEKDVSGSTKITFPILKRIIETELELGFKLPIPPLELDKISFDFDNLNFQIPTYPLVFIQRFGGEINNFAPSSKDPIEFSGKSGATLGPQIDFSFNAPAFDININETIELIRADLDIKFSSDELKGTGKVTLLDDKLLTGSGIITLNLEKKFFELKGNFSLIDGLITTNSSFKVDSKFNINLVGEGSANIPKFIPTIGGQSLVDAALLVQYKNNDKLSDDFIAVWTTVKADVKGIDIDIPLGLKVFFNGQVQQIFSGLPPTNSFIVAPNKNWILLTADWENSSDSTKIRIKKPDGTFLVESDFEANNIALVEDLNNSDTRAAVVLNPSAGIWDIEVVDPNGLGKIEYNGIGDSVAPSIAITSPSTDIISKGSINIGFNALDSDSTAEVKLFYDDDNLGLNGILIADGIVENDGASNFTWNTEEVPVGDYFIYAMIMDDSNIPVFSSYSTGKIGIAALNSNNPPVLSNAIADQNTAQNKAFNFTFDANTFTDIDAGDTLTYSTTLVNGNALPNWLTFNPTTRTYSGTPINDNVGNLNIKLTATDSSGTTATDSFTLTVNIDNPNLVTLADLKNDPTKFMELIRDYDGNNLGSSSSWKIIGEVDVQGDGDLETLLVNPKIERWATVGSVDGIVNFGNNGLGGDTRVVGIYIDPTLAGNPENIGGPFDSQRRFQNDLRIDNLSLLGGADYNKDSFQDVYFKVNDGSAVLRSLMHKDGNIQYANYQSKADLTSFMTANGVSSSIWGSWI